MARRPGAGGGAAWPAPRSLSRRGFARDGGCGGRDERERRRLWWCAAASPMEGGPLRRRIAASAAHGESTGKREQFYNTLRDVLAGTAGGAAGIILDHPFDLIKTRLQVGSSAEPTGNVARSAESASPGRGKAAGQRTNMNKPQTGRQVTPSPPSGSERATRALARHAARSPLQEVALLLKQEGPLAFFKGMAAPIVAYGPTYALAFGAYGNAVRFLDNNHILEGNGADAAAGDIPLARVTAAGAWAGLLCTVFVAPTELIKVRMQIQREVAGRDGGYVRPWTVARKAVAQHGIVNGLFRGWCVTVVRDIPSVSAFFALYEWSKAKLLAWSARREVDDGREPSGHVVTPAWVLIAAGFFSGPISWAVAYPVDVVKTIVQTQTVQSAERPSAMAIARQGVARHGVRFFTRGLGTTLVGTAPATALCLLVYEHALAAMHGTAVLDADAS